MKPRSKIDKDACHDEATNCKEFITFCTTPIYSSFLKQHCNLKCGHCAPPPTNCEDAFGSSCQKWDTDGFCTTKTMSKEMKRSMCAKTCKLCGKETNKPGCDQASTKYSDQCIAQTCANSAEKETAECKKYCADPKHKDSSECKSSTTDCSKDKFASDCLKERSN
jgi:hypothetical protein